MAMGQLQAVKDDIGACSTYLPDPSETFSMPYCGFLLSIKVGKSGSTGESDIGDDFKDLMNRAV